MVDKEVIRDRATALQMLLAMPPTERVPAKTRVRTREQTCRCGSCKICVGNARWERLYNEKFADADYYKGLRLTNRSPLAGF